MKCPRQDPLAGGRDVPSDVDCPSCGAAIEFFPSGTIRKCPGCGERVQNPRLSEEPAEEGQSG